MFADVAGSTKLYEKQGDLVANQVISEVLELMQESILAHQGTVIKTIGDEVMCSFENANQCANSAIEIQEKLQLGMVHGHFVAVRIGFHSGRAIMQEDGDIFGDTVNTAARMAGIAKGRQIIISQESMELLEPALKLKAREFDRVQVKGKSDSILISELVWENAGVTQMVSFDSLVTQTKQKFVISCGSFELQTDSEGTDIQLGRNEDCDLVVDAKLASRFHARISARKGEFVITDQSTNGTFIQMSDGTSLFLRGDQMRLKNSGLISLGSNIEPSTDNLISYKVIQN